MFRRGLQTIKCEQIEKAKKCGALALARELDLEFICIALFATLQIFSFFWTMTMTDKVTLTEWNLDCDNVTKCVIYCIVELWLEMHQMCRKIDSVTNTSTTVSKYFSIYRTPSWSGAPVNEHGCFHVHHSARRNDRPHADMLYGGQS